MNVNFDKFKSPCSNVVNAVASAVVISHFDVMLTHRLISSDADLL